MKTIQRTILAIAFVLFLVCVPRQANAQFGYNIEVSPVKVNQEISRGRSFTQTFRVGNYSGHDQTLFVYAQDFAVTDELGAVSFFEAEETSLYALSKWTRVLEPEIFVPNGKVKEVDVVISVPPKAESGGHYAAIFFQTDKPVPIRDGGASTIAAIGRIASLLLVSVPGDVTEKVLLTEFFADKKIYWNTNPTVELVSLIKNEGNVHVVPIGVMFLQGGLNYTAENVIYNQIQTAILPGSPPRKISEQIKVEREGFIPVIGRIQVDLLARYGGFGQEISGAIAFWVIPIKFIVTVIVAVLIMLFVTWRVIVSFKKDKKGHSGQPIKPRVGSHTEVLTKY